MKRINLADAALVLLFAGLLAALLVHVLVSNPLRRAVLDEAARRPVEIEVVSDATFLTAHMQAGDRQAEIELLSFEIEREKLVARFRVRARDWRGHLQYGDFTLVPGERFEFYAGRYKLIGTIRHVRP